MQAHERAHLERVLLRLAAQNGLASERIDISRHFSLLSEHTFPADSDATRPLSALSGDGTPFELSTSVGANGSRGLRYVIDVGASLPPTTLRLAECNEKTLSLLAQLGQNEHVSTATRVLRHLDPLKGTEPRSRFFGVWHGLSYSPAQATTLKLYHNLRLWDLPVSWAMLEGTLENTGAHTVASTSLLGWLQREEFSPAFCGIEYKEGRLPRTKMYFRGTSLSRSRMDRLLERCSLDWSIPLYSYFRHAATGSSDALPPRSWVVCINISQNGHFAIDDLKLELAVRRYFFCDQDAESAIVRLFREFGLDEKPYLETVSVLNPGPLSMSRVLIHNVVSLGVSKHHETRLNVYFNGGPKYS